jgi:anoctamin-8
MEVMCLIAVLVNCALIGLSGQVHRMFPEMSTTQTILLIVALEVRLTTFTLLDDVPVQQELHTCTLPHMCGL